MLKLNYLYKVKFIFIAGFICLLFGCNNTLEPLDEERGSFSVFGGLNLYSDINYFRVKDLNIPLMDDTTQNIDATVTLEDLDRGISQTLRDTTVEFEGVITHNFRSTIDVRQDTDYQITAETANGETVTATAETPFIAENTVDTSSVDFECRQLVEVTFKPVKPESQLRIAVGFRADRRFGGQMFFSSVDPRRIERQNMMLSFTFVPSQVIREALNDPDLPPRVSRCTLLASNIFTVDYLHLGPGFRDNIAFEDSLNIPGGAGRFVGFYRDSFEIEIVNIDHLL